MEFEKVLDGVVRYINREMYTGMNDVQEVLARMAVGRVVNNRAAIKKALIDNSVIRTFGVISEDGMVDIDSLAAELKEQIKIKGKMQISIPFIGKFTFVPEDVDKLLAEIKRNSYETY